MDLDKDHHSLVQAIENKRAVLFLGSGANYSCVHKKTGLATPPMGNALRDAISNEFLGGKGGGDSLAAVAEYAISERSIPEVQEYVKTLFDDYEICVGHKIATSIAWAGIATTNYDTILEDAYSQGHSVQKLQPIIANDDNLETLLKSPDKLAYLKLHGCFTRIGAKDPPLILSNDQYSNYKEGRENLFDTLSEWATNLVLIFVGYSGQDQNIRRYVNHLTENIEFRPRYYFVKPTFEPYEINFWTSKRITPIELGFDDFMRSLDKCFSGKLRGLQIQSTPTIGIENKFVTHDAVLSANAALFVSQDCIYVPSLKEGDLIDPLDFYKGISNGWQWAIQDLDVQRNVVDSMIEEQILVDDPSQPTGLKVALLLGYGGSGKSVGLKRAAWEAGKSYDHISLYLRDNGKLNAASVQEIIDLTKLRVFIFIDEACKSVRDIKKFIKNLGDHAAMVTLVLAARTNEWSVVMQECRLDVDATYELDNLNHKEVVRLVDKLKDENALCNLERFSTEERIKRLKDYAGSNLLVALHEATMGKPFQEIIYDEYESIASESARKLYLMICVMNRLGIPVRAGMIARITGINFDRFQQDFFTPLSKIVCFENDAIVRDMVYSARHPIIAQMIFDQVLVDHFDRFEYYSKVLNNLNLGYASDEKAFREMIKGRALNKLFSEVSFIEEIYRIAEDKVGRVDYLLHQRGIFEMHKNGADLSKATSYLEEAEQLNPTNPSIQHSLSELALKKAGMARTSLEKDKYLRKAQSLAKSVTKKRNTSHAFHTLSKVALSRVEEHLNHVNGSDDASIQGLVKEAERTIREGLLQFPNDSYLLHASAELAKMLNETPKVLDALRQAFNANKKLSYIARQLFDCYVANKNYAEAEAIIQEAIDIKGADRDLCYTYGAYLMDHKHDPEKSVYFLQKSFVPNDKKFDAQIRYGCELFRASRYEECYKFFSSNHGKARVSGFAGSFLYPMEDIRIGTIQRVERSYITVKDGSSKMTVHCKREDSRKLGWDKAIVGDKVSFELGFNYLGLIGRKLSYVNGN